MTVTQTVNTPTRKTSDPNFFKDAAAFKLIWYKPYKQRFYEMLESHDEVLAMKTFLFFQVRRDNTAQRQRQGRLIAQTRRPASVVAITSKAQ